METNSRLHYDEDHAGEPLLVQTTTVSKLDL